MYDVPPPPSPNLKDYLCSHDVAQLSFCCGQFAGFAAQAVWPHPQACPLVGTSACAATAIAMAIDQRQIALHNYETQLSHKRDTKLMEKLGLLYDGQSLIRQMCGTNREKLNELLERDTKLMEKLGLLHDGQSRVHQKCAANEERLNELLEQIKKERPVITEQPGASNQPPADCDERKNK